MAEGSTSDPAMEVADVSYGWYHGAAQRARKWHRLSEATSITVAALVPLSVVVVPGNAVLPALLGSIVVVSTGSRALFHWHEDYLRFSRAREAVEAERRRYKFRSPPYEQLEDRGRLLVEAVTRIEQEEMGQWLESASPSRGAQGDQQ